jgi:K+:H+ antiporter
MLPFSLLIAIAMSITAFPVLARILDDQKLSATKLGHIAIACAALNDVLAWSILAWVVAISRTHEAWRNLGAGSVCDPAVTYILVMFAAMRPALRWFMGRITGRLGLLSPALFSMMVIMALVTTVITTPLLKFVLPEEHRCTALKVS